MSSEFDFDVTIYYSTYSKKWHWNLPVPKKEAAILKKTKKSSIMKNETRYKK